MDFAFICCGVLTITAGALTLNNSTHLQKKKRNKIETTSCLSDLFPISLYRHSHKHAKFNFNDETIKKQKKTKRNHEFAPLSVTNFTGIFYFFHAPYTQSISVLHSSRILMYSLSLCTGSHSVAITMVKGGHVFCFRIYFAYMPLNKSQSRSRSQSHIGFLRNVLKMLKQFQISLRKTSKRL